MQGVSNFYRARCRGGGQNLFLVLNKADKLLTGGGQSFRVPEPGGGGPKKCCSLRGLIKYWPPPLGKFLDPCLIGTIATLLVSIYQCKVWKFRNTTIKQLFFLNWRVLSGLLGAKWGVACYSVTLLCAKRTIWTPKSVGGGGKRAPQRTCLSILYSIQYTYLSNVFFPS